MVRFIIFESFELSKRIFAFTFQYGQIYYKCIFNAFGVLRGIYIPIWLDLLCILQILIKICKSHLHSNMVRFIILDDGDPEKSTNDLHSNMVRFIIYISFRYMQNSLAIYIPIWLDLLCFPSLRMLYRIFLFTFQYGQIYYSVRPLFFILKNSIYIPIWLDLLFTLSLLLVYSSKTFTFQYGQIYYCRISLYISYYNIYLHSNMVRFIIITTPQESNDNSQFTFQYGQIYYEIEAKEKELMLNIYIPIWLDLLYTVCPFSSQLASIFTFQYGQIYYKRFRTTIQKRTLIYIPIWLDLLYTLSSFLVYSSYTFTFQYGQIYYPFIKFNAYHM